MIVIRKCARWCRSVSKQLRWKFLYQYNPLVKTDSRGKSDFLKNVFWDLRITAGPDVRYFLEQGGSLVKNVVGTTLIDTRLNVEEGGWIEVTGRIEDGTFAILLFHKFRS